MITGVVNEHERTSVFLTRQAACLVVSALFIGCGKEGRRTPTDESVTTAAVIHEDENPDEDVDSPLRVELQASPLSITFTNTSQKPLRILKPLDGSEWCWIMPHYKLTITDEQGKEVPLVSRCGNFGYPYSETRWPDDYLVTIPAGQKHTQPLELLHNVRRLGVHILRFQYRFTPKTDQTPGGPYPPDLWRGTATSKQIKKKLTPGE